MDRSFKLILALGLPLFTIIVMLVDVRSTGLDPRQQAVKEYVQYRSTTLTQLLQAGQSTQARLPHHLRADMSKTSFGNSTYYQTGQRYDDQRYTEPVATPVWTLMTKTLTETLLEPLPTRPTTKPEHVGYAAGRPVPYPPNDLWCVQLTGADSAAPKVILVALHQDIFNAEWIVHEVTDPETVLATVGCQFSLP